MSIGKRLREYIYERKLSQEEFSSLTNISKQTVNNIVMDRTAPSGDVLVKIANEYKDLNLNWLVTGNGPIFNSAGSNSKSTPSPNNVTKGNFDIIVNEKERTISNQKDMIETLKETIAYQRQLLSKFMDTP